MSVISKLQQKNQLWQVLNSAFKKEDQKTFTPKNRKPIFSQISTPRTLNIKTKLAEKYWTQMTQMAVFQQPNQQLTQQQLYNKIQRNIMAENHHIKKQYKKSQLKQNVLNNILDQIFKTDQSQIRNQNQSNSDLSTPYQKQQKIKNFLKRQQFKNKQSIILKQMQQFCQYGVIKKDFHQRA